MGPGDDPGGREGEAPRRSTRRYATPTGEPCPRAVRVDGTVEGTGECLWCGYCLLIAEAAWSGPQPGSGP
jgi:hypothetical protein